MVKENQWQQIFDRIGEPAALDQLAEEAAELSAAAAKLARVLRGDNPARASEENAYLAVVEEVADTFNAVDVLDVGLSPSRQLRRDAYERQPWKMTRWYKSLFGEEAGGHEQG